MKRLVQFNANFHFWRRLNRAVLLRVDHFDGVPTPGVLGNRNQVILIPSDGFPRSVLHFCVHGMDTMELHHEFVLHDPNLDSIKLLIA